MTRPAPQRNAHRNATHTAEEPRVVLDGEEETAAAVSGRTFWDEEPAPGAPGSGSAPSRRLDVARAMERAGGRAASSPALAPPGASRAVVGGGPGAAPSRRTARAAAAELAGPPSDPAAANLATEGPLGAFGAALASLAGREPGAALREIRRCEAQLAAIEGVAIRAAYEAAGWRDSPAADLLGVGRTWLQGLTQPGRRHAKIGEDARAHRAPLGIRGGPVPRKRGPE